MTLVIATDGPCTGHACDGCATCKKGRCCRRDNPDYRLPELGEWDGPIYGELGKLCQDGDSVQCHCCGQSFRALGTHVWSMHDLSADEYKAIFGLMSKTKLVCLDTQRLMREVNGPRVREMARIYSEGIFEGMTPEQRHDLATRPKRLETQRLLAQMRPQTLARLRERMRELRSDSEWVAQVSRKISEGRGGLKCWEEPCIVCDTMVSCNTRRNRRDGRHKATCSDACLREYRRRCSRAYQLGKRDRKTHCKNGHPLTDENVKWVGKLGNRRQCRICEHQYQVRAGEKEKARQARTGVPCVVCGKLTPVEGIKPPGRRRRPTCSEACRSIHESRIKEAALARKTHCKHGHPLSGDNLYLRDCGNDRMKRICLACRRLAKAKQEQNRKARGQLLSNLPGTVLQVAMDGACKGHPCDKCETCQKGRCCRHDNPNYKLPELGDWDGPIYGQLGRLRDDGDKVECHCCGQYFDALGMHAWWSHDLTAEEYKSIFGLRVHTGLVGPRHEKVLQKLNETHLAAVRPSTSFLATLTSEQRSHYGKGWKRRLESAIDPDVCESRKHAASKGARTRVRLYREGKLRLSMAHLRPYARVANLKAQETLRRRREQDPEWWEQVKKRISAARGGPGTGNCVICGAEFTAQRHLITTGQKKTCGKPECRSEFKRRNSKKARVSARPEFRAKLRAAGRARRFVRDDLGRIRTWVRNDA